MEQGFVDLRQNGHGQGMGDSFWPSFTDIMTVIVMIFIITSTVLILRNWELVAELRQTVEAERQARTLAQQREATNQTLEEQLANLQTQLSETRIRNLRLVEESEGQQARLSEQEQEILALRSDKQRLQSDIRAAERRETVVAEQLAQALSSVEHERTERERLQAEYERRGERLTSALAQLEELEQSLQQRLAELGQMREERGEARQQLADLRGEYETLEAKYQELIRPARSAQGKQVVDVRYGRRYGRYGGDERIQLRGPDTPGYIEVSQEEMHQRLSRLKERYGEDLYVKVIIPSDSGLSYNEAWEFTRNLLNRYDYYYQD